MTLEDWVRTAEPAREGDGDLMLQMDIEGAEYRNLMATSSSCLKRFRIIILEIHFLGIFMHNRDSAIEASLKGLIHGLSMPLRFSLQSPHQSDLLSRIIARYDNSFRPYLIRAALRRLHQSHLCVHVHPNNCLGEFLDKETGLNVPDVIELTYLRRDRFIGDSAKLHPPQSPHPLDIINVPERPNIILNSRWIS